MLTGGTHGQLDNIARHAEEQEIAVDVLAIPQVQIIAQIDFLLALHHLACRCMTGLRRHPDAACNDTFPIDEL